MRIRPGRSIDLATEQVRDALVVEDRSAALESLARSESARDVLLRLAQNEDKGVRGWIPGLAAELLGADAVTVLLKLLEDDDPDTRVAALATLEEVDPARLSGEVGRLTKRLQSGDPHETLATAWALARISDADAVEAIETARNSAEPSHWLRKALDAVLLFMTEPHEVAARLRSHDHERTLWLAYAAGLLGTDEAIAALRDCAATAEDERCRNICKYRLEELGSG